MSKYELYIIDCETTGTDPRIHEPVEISIIRKKTGEQKTWHLKPVNINTISDDALRVNGLKKEDLLHQTKFGIETYKDPAKVIVEIENWLMEDFMSSSDRIICAHNANFDKNMLQALWEKCGSIETYPLNTKYVLDTFQLEFMKDIINEEISPGGYSLFALAKKYGIKNEKAHSAAADTSATLDLLNKQIAAFKKMIK